MSEKNCRELAREKDVDGFLVGGASLKPACKSPFYFFLHFISGVTGYRSFGSDRRLFCSAMAPFNAISFWRESRD